jgi:lysophospholipase L1-like esterase
MTKSTLCRCLSLFLLILFGNVRAADWTVEVLTKPTPKLDADIWKKMHLDFVAQAQKGQIDIVFLGDSLTQGWSGQGLKIWQKEFEPLHAANFGIASDGIQHVLWRVENGELDGLKPKAIVLMIGANNLNKAVPADSITVGIKNLVQKIQAKAPNANVMLVGILPFSEPAKGVNGKADREESNEKAKAVNAALSKFDDGKKLRFIDLTSDFAPNAQPISEYYVKDGVHLSAKGYEKYCEVMLPVLKELMAKSTK